MLDQEQLAAELSHVFWIGGSPCAGKSSIGHTLARVYVFVGYHVDTMARNHLARQLAAGDPLMTAFARMNLNQRWVERSVETLVQETLESWTNGFRLVIEDLLAMPKENFIIAEGNFFPECVAPYLSSPHQAIWLVPSDAFCDQTRRRRDAELSQRQKAHGIRSPYSDPEKRLSNIIARDCQLAHHVRQEAEPRHLTFYEVDGSRSLDEMTALVEQHFEPYLVERLHSMKPA
ncbi:MAG: hypothetical protein J2P37_30650 [Ktedonobacteraceae bacterium]|nr:hypothetical protein [Ktedonobacteraceae bacterium]